MYPYTAVGPLLESVCKLTTETYKMSKKGVCKVKRDAWSFPNRPIQLYKDSHVPGASFRGEPCRQNVKKGLIKRSKKISIHHVCSASCFFFTSLAIIMSHMYSSVLNHSLWQSYFFFTSLELFCFFSSREKVIFSERASPRQCLRRSDQIWKRVKTLARKALDVLACSACG